MARGALLRTGHEHGKLLKKQVWFAFADLISALSGVPLLVYANSRDMYGKVK